MTTIRHPGSVAGARAQELIRAFDGRAGSLGSLLGRVTPVDQVGVEERVDALKKRSIKKASKLWALDLAIRMIDLTTLEGKDTPGKIHALCAKAMHPQPGDPTIPHVAAICVYPALVAEAREALGESGVHVASVATGFPSGQTFLEHQARRDARGRRRRRRRGRHGHRPPAPSCRVTTTRSGARPSWRWPPAPTSSRPPPAR